MDTQLAARISALVEPLGTTAGPDALDIGVLTPLSGTGDRTAGELCVRGASLGARYAAEVLGQPVTLRVSDDQHGTDTEPMARTAVGQLAKLAVIDRVSAVVGQWHLRTTLNVAQACEELGVPVFIENGHNTVNHGRRHVYRTYFSIADRAPLMAEFALTQGWRRIAVVASDTVFATMLADTVVASLEQTIPDVEILRLDLDQEQCVDVTDEIEQVRSFEPDLLINAGVVRTNYLIIEGAREAGLLPGVPLMVCFPFPMRSADYWRLAGEAGEGVVWPATRFSPGWSGLTDIGRWFVQQYSDTFGDLPPDNALNAFTDVTILAQAALRAGSTDRAALTEALDSGTFDTWRGPVSFGWSDTTGRHDLPEIVLMHYPEIGATVDDATIVWPPEAATGPYVPSRERDLA